MRAPVALAAAGTALITGVLAGCGGASRSAIGLRDWECAQDARDNAELQAALLHPATLGPFGSLARQLRSLDVPGLEPVSFVDSVMERPLPYAALGAIQRDTLRAWLETDAPPAVRLDRDVYDAPPNELDQIAPELVGTCPPRSLPQPPLLSGSVPADIADQTVSPNEVDAGWELGDEAGAPSHRAAVAAEAAVDLDVRRGSPAQVQGPLALLLGGTFARDVLASAASGPAREDYDGDGDGLLGSVAGRDGRSSLRLSARQIVDVVIGMRRDPRSLHRLLAGLASAAAESLQGAARSDGNPRDADEFGAFVGLLDVAAWQRRDAALAGATEAFDRAVVLDLAGHPKRAAGVLAHAEPTDPVHWADESDAFRDFVVSAALVDSGDFGSPDAIQQAVCRDCTSAWFLDASGDLAAELPETAVGNLAAAFRVGSPPRLKALLADAQEADRWREAGGCCS